MDDIKIVAVILVIFLMGLAGVWVLKSKIEADSFNSITGKNITTWQAMWVDLRIQEQGR